MLMAFFIIFFFPSLCLNALSKYKQKEKKKKKEREKILTDLILDMARKQNGCSAKKEG